MMIVPLTIREATKVVAREHRTHKPPRGGLWAVGLAVDGVLRGAAIVGRPVARMAQDGWTAEVLRVAVPAGTQNGCSMLLAACWRAARALGWRRLITYTRATEPGTSLRAAGWREVGRVKAESWSRESRPRVEEYPEQEKIRWEAGS
ncbi:MAG: hypothetical protein HC927_02185 [Deltaproteobacteria bacterium]|nr:hypothetical protein [Deltaproteobacteria bacterium]